MAPQNHRVLQLLLVAHNAREQDPVTEDTTHFGFMTEIKLELTWELRFLCLAFMVPEGILQVTGEAKSYTAVNPAFYATSQASYAH